MTQRRKNIMLGTAGHVDHGKTALVKMLTGCNTDTLAEEKARGLTIEPGFAPCRMADDRIVGIVDVPGHVGFIRNMVAGAQGVDVLMLVIAADDGIMPQTREHMDILTLMGVRFGLVIITKIDMVDEKRIAELTAQVQAFIRGTFLEGKAICGVSNITGNGYDNFLTELNREVDIAAERSVTGLFRQWSERSFHVKGFGTVSAGIPCSGSIKTGQTLCLWPSGKKVRVRQLEVYGELSDTARAGECAALNLADTPAEQCGRGCLLSEKPVGEAEMFEASLCILGSVEKGIKDHAEVQLHVGTVDATVKVIPLSPGSMDANWRGYVQFRSRTRLPIVPGERFVIRGQSGAMVTTLGGGVFLDRSNHKLRRNRPWTLERLEKLAGAVGSPQLFLKYYLETADRVFTREELCDLLQLRDDEICEIISALATDGEAIALGETVVGKKYFNAACDAITDALGKYHAACPQANGMDKAALAGEVKLQKELFSSAFEKLIDDRKIKEQAGAAALSSFKPSLSEGISNLYDDVLYLLKKTQCQPPRPDEIAERLKCELRKVDEILNLLCGRGLAVRLADNVFMHVCGVDKARDVVLELFRRKNLFETVEFRDALGVSRKYAVPLLDYLDVVHWTVRNGNIRRPGRLARETLNGDK